MRIPPHEAEQCAPQNAQKCSGVISNLPLNEIHDVFNVAQTLSLRPIFYQYAETRFLWEFMDMGNDSVILKLVNSLISAWVQNETNVHRAAKAVNRQPYDKENLVSGFAIFRMKSRADGPDWVIVRDHGWTGPDDPDGSRPQTVVLIALSDLSWDNGFFMRMEAGSHVCLDVRAEILYPPTGGGLGIAVWLRL